MNPNQLTEKIIKACYEVHTELSIGFVEKVYENALVIALRELGLRASPQHPIQVHFRNQVIGEYFADILVEEKIVLELKAVKTLRPEHQAQLINYLNASHLNVGLLINFAKKGLEIKRASSR